MPRAPNQKYRPPACVVTRAMADAGKLALDNIMTLDIEEHTDDELVTEIFQAMWETYWHQVEEAKRRKRPGGLLMPTPGLVRQ